MVGSCGVALGWSQWNLIIYIIHVHFHILCGFSAMLKSEWIGCERVCVLTLSHQNTRITNNKLLSQIFSSLIMHKQQWQITNSNNKSQQITINLPHGITVVAHSLRNWLENVSSSCTQSQYARQKFNKNRNDSMRSTDKRFLFSATVCSHGIFSDLRPRYSKPRRIWVHNYTRSHTHSHSISHSLGAICVCYIQRLVVLSRIRYALLHTLFRCCAVFSLSGFFSLGLFPCRCVRILFFTVSINALAIQRKSNNNKLRICYVCCVCACACDFFHPKMASIQ